MSLHTLKKKVVATVLSPSASHDSTSNGNGSFSLNGGPRNLSYIGKSSRNSSVTTPFRGTIPMGFNGNTGMQNNIVVNFPTVKAELGQTAKNHIQPSVQTTKSMIATKYKWIGGQYPNHWVQPTTNLSASERTAMSRMRVSRMRVSRIHTMAASECIPANTDTPIPLEQPPCCDNTSLRRLGNNQSSDYTIRKRLVKSTHTTETPLTDTSDRITRLQAVNIITSGADKPFPYYTNTSCGIVGANDNGTLLPSDWYKTVAPVACE